MRTGLMYTASRLVTSMTNGMIWEMLASPDTPFILHAFYVSQNRSVPLIQQVRIRDLGAVLGAPGTEVALHTRNTVAADTQTGFAGEFNSGGTPDFEAFQWDLSKVLEWLPAPKDRIYVPAGDGIGLFTGTIGGTRATLVWEEL